MLVTGRQRSGTKWILAGICCVLVGIECMLVFLLLGLFFNVRAPGYGPLALGLLLAVLTLGLIMLSRGIYLNLTRRDKLIQAPVSRMGSQTAAVLSDNPYFDDTASEASPPC